jgi:hypothetical protein
MAPLLLLSSDQDGAAVLPARARVRHRVAARLRARRLDRELAAGTAPGARPALTLRAQALGERSVRTTLAKALRHAIAEAHRPQTLSIAQVPLHRSAVRRAAEELDALASRLLAPGPVAARGIAQARLLLTDGASPLYDGGATEELRDVAGRALAALEPAFGW